MNHDPIPQHWSPEVALAVFEFLNELCDAIWQLYEVDLVDHLRSELHNDPHSAQYPTPDESPFNDDIPF
jgi:hypothetical protein